MCPPFTQVSLWCLEDKNVLKCILTPSANCTSKFKFAVGKFTLPPIGARLFALLEWSTA